MKNTIFLCCLLLILALLCSCGTGASAPEVPDDAPGDAAEAAPDVGTLPDVETDETYAYYDFSLSELRDELGAYIPPSGLKWGMKNGEVKDTAGYATDPDEKADFRAEKYRDGKIVRYRFTASGNTYLALPEPIGRTTSDGEFFGMSAFDFIIIDSSPEKAFDDILAELRNVFGEETRGAENEEVGSPDRTCTYYIWSEKGLDKMADRESYIMLSKNYRDGEIISVELQVTLNVI